MNTTKSWFQAYIIYIGLKRDYLGEKMNYKTMSAKDKKVAIEAELVTGVAPRKLADKYDVHYTTVLSYRTAMREAGVTNEDIAVLVDTDAGMVRAVAKEITKKAVEAEILPTKDAIAKEDAIVDGVNGLKTLNTEFQDTITRLLHKANDFISDDMKLSEFRQVAGTVGDLHEKVFSKGGTQVNVQQNNSNGGFSSGMVN